jgi:acetylornithine deacetylase/succinyl-diaminopimelate desuccinylase-like protein
MKETIEYIGKEQKRYLSELFDFLRIPSISSVPEHKHDMERCSEWLVNHLKGIGFDDTRVIPTAGHPIVFGQWLGAGEKSKTVLIYGHYDVQPVDPLDLWTTKPFEPEIRNGFIFARGSCDDKGQTFANIKSVEAYLKTSGKLPVNIKFLIEGEEEAGTSHLDEFIENNAELLKCDAVLVSDTEFFAPGVPSLCYGLRGISFVELTVTGPNRDVHSGSYGGAIENPITVLAWMISQLKDKYGRITIPGFYDDVLELTEEERNEFRKLPFSEHEYCKDLEIGGVNGEYGFTTLERCWARPALDINGIYGGYTGEGSKTIIPSKATAKISMRLVPNQHAEDITNKICDFLEKIAPPTVKIEIIRSQGGNPVLVPTNGPAVKSALSAIRQGFDREPVLMREGGSIPIVGLFKNVLNAPTVLLGYGLPSDNIHSPNENFSVSQFIGGIKTTAIFLDEYSKS